TLLAYEPRFAVVAADAGWPLPASGSWCVVVVERLPGGATTDFGAPGAIGDFDRKALTRREAARAADLVAGAWRVFDRVVARAPSTLRKGPRGGGRDLDAIVAHVKDAQDAYARKLGMGKPRGQEEILAVLRGARSADPIKPNGWPPRYAARRIAWHVVDRENDRVDPPVGRDVVVEGADRLGVGVVDARIDDAAGPQHVVGEQHAAGP